MEKGEDPLFSAISYPRDMVGKRESFPQRRGRGRFSTRFPRGIHREMWAGVIFLFFLRRAGIIILFFDSDSYWGVPCLRARVTFGHSPKSDQKDCLKPQVSKLPHALCQLQIRCCVPHVHENLPVSFRQRTVSATAPLPLTGSTNSTFGSTVAAHERQRRKREVSSSYGAIRNMFCERVVQGIKIRSV